MKSSSQLGFTKEAITIVCNREARTQMKGIVTVGCTSIVTMVFLWFDKNKLKGPPIVIEPRKV